MARDGAIPRSQKLSLQHIDTLLDELAAEPVQRWDNKYAVPKLDLSEVRHFSPAGLLAIWAYKKWRNESGVEMYVGSPGGKRHYYLIFMKFFDAIAEHGHKASRFWNPLDACPDVLFPITTIATSKDVERATLAARTRVGRLLMSSLGYDRDDVNAFTTFVGEACNNVVDYAGQHGALAAAKYRAGGKDHVQICVADTGCGIRRSLRTHHRKATQSDEAAVHAALQKGISGSGSKTRGNGLATMRAAVARFDGVLDIISGHTHCCVHGPTEAFRTLKHPFPGTLIATDLVKTETGQRVLAF